MTKNNYFLKVTIYNYRSAIVESDEDLTKYDSDQIEELNLANLDVLRLQRNDKEQYNGKCKCNWK
jgi:hypothetical protein